MTDYSRKGSGLVTKASCDGCGSINSQTVCLACSYTNSSFTLELLLNVPAEQRQLVFHQCHLQVSAAAVCKLLYFHASQAAWIVKMDFSFTFDSSHISATTLSWPYIQLIGQPCLASLNSGNMFVCACVCVSDTFIFHTVLRVVRSRLKSIGCGKGLTLQLPSAWWKLIVSFSSFFRCRSSCNFSLTSLIVLVSATAGSSYASTI